MVGKTGSRRYRHCRRTTGTATPGVKDIRKGSAVFMNIDDAKLRAFAGLRHWLLGRCREKKTEENSTTIPSYDRRCMLALARRWHHRCRPIDVDVLDANEKHKVFTQYDHFFFCVVFERKGLSSTKFHH